MAVTCCPVFGGAVSGAGEVNAAGPCESLAEDGRAGSGAEKRQGRCGRLRSASAAQPAGTGRPASFKSSVSVNPVLRKLGKMIDFLHVIFLNDKKFKICFFVWLNALQVFYYCCSETILSFSNSDQILSEETMFPQAFTSLLINLFPV